MATRAAWPKGPLSEAKTTMVLASTPRSFSASVAVANRHPPMERARCYVAYHCRDAGWCLTLPVRTDHQILAGSAAAVLRKRRSQTPSPLSLQSSFAKMHGASLWLQISVPHRPLCALVRVKGEVGLTPRLGWQQVITSRILRNFIRCRLVLHLLYNLLALKTCQ
jgi:hypothetical protein